MPAQRPCASFDPISPDLDLAALVEETPTFEYVDRIAYDMIEHQGLEAFEKLVLLHVIIRGKPLVVEGFHRQLDQWTFTTQWLRDNVGTKFEQARNLTKGENMPLSLNHYLNNMALLTNQWNVHNFRRLDRQRIYLKDIDCPQVWHDKLKEEIPPAVFYLNESTGDIGGPGSVYESNIHGSSNKKGRGIARAGDLMSCMPTAMRADNLMCYIGHEGTYTPAHREMCASLGQNIMVEASGSVDEDGNASKPGSSIWFMTETKDRHLVSEYWLSTLGHDIEVEAHFAQINAWKAAPFTTYIVEQKVGDFILIPPLAPHQVWNRGTRTMKVAWNRTTVETLEMAIHEALPRARMVCRDEQYKNKAMILFALQRYSGLLKQADSQKEIINSPKVRQLQKDFKRLHKLFTEILLSEMLGPVGPTEKSGQYLPYDSNVTCSYCRANIFNRFLTCTSCIVALENGDEDTYDICMDCYAMGRSCRCISKLKWVEQFPWKDLVDKHDIWRHQIINMEGLIDETSPQPLTVERKRLDKKTLAEVCQQQLKLRPWRDPKKPEIPEVEEKESEDEINIDGSIKKKRKKRRSEKWLKENLSCHICKHRDPLWKLAVCECGTAYCYGSLWRAFDMMPQSIMEDSDWKCPRCRKICSCGGCRKDPQMRPFEPNGTVLGHDTKKFADPRSIESLVDFSYSNIGWVKKAGDDHPHETRRLRRRLDEAETAKSKESALDDNYVDEETPTSSRTRSIVELEADPNIDPQLNGLTTNSQSPRYESRQMPTVAQQALEAMNGMTTLEKDPEGFRLLASIDNSNSIPFVAPPAQMVDQPLPKLTTNGITYEYPDPTVPNDLPTQTTNFHPSNHFPRNVSVGQKRKRVSDAVGVQFDLPPPPKNSANTQYVQAQNRQTMAKAQKKDRRISAEAAMSGKQLLLKLPVDMSRLNGFSPINQRQQSPETGGADIENGTDAPLLQSDLPVTASPPVNGITTPRAEPSPKRRSIRLENDEDFSLRRSRKQRSSGVNRPAGRPKSTTNYAESSEGSDDDGDLDITREKNMNQSKAKERPLPSYLARRRSPEVNTAEELPPKANLRPLRKRALDPRQPSKDAIDTAINGDNQIQTQGSKPQSTFERVDDFAAEPIPEPSLDIDLEKLGPGATNLTPSGTNTSAQENCKDNISPSANGFKPKFASALAQENHKDVTGPGATNVTPSILSSSAQENRKAKMIAMRSVQFDGFVDDYESDSPQEQPESIKKLIDSKAAIQHRSLSDNGNSSKQSVMSKTPHIERRSIFSKPGKKIRVTSMKKR